MSRAGSKSNRLVFMSHDVVADLAVGDSRAAVDELLDMLADPHLDTHIRAVIQQWLNG